MKPTLPNEVKANLIQSAVQARKKAYTPYSKYKVGAALLAKSGEIYTGANVENAAYPSGMCAERVAIFKAAAEGKRKFKALAVVTANAGSPCGGCRQVMAEFGLDMLVLIADTKGNIKHELTVADLLPGAFTPKDLPRE